MIKKVLIYPQDKDILTQKSEPVTTLDENTKSLIQDLKDTLANSEGCGISAIQIGIPKRICVIKPEKDMIVLINPEITKTHGCVLFKEGCLSAPDTFVTVQRHQRVNIDYINEKGEKTRTSKGGLASIIIQHELDHFDGWCPVFSEVKEK